MKKIDYQVKPPVKREYYILEIWNRMRITLKSPKIPTTIKHFNVSILVSSVYINLKYLNHIFAVLKTFLTFPSIKSVKSIAPLYSMFHNLKYIVGHLSCWKHLLQITL